MKEREAKLLCTTNKLKTAIIQPATDDKGWTLKLVAKNGVEGMLVSKRSTSPRVFKTLDACINCCKRIELTPDVTLPLTISY